MASTKVFVRTKLKYLSAMIMLGLQSSLVLGEQQEFYFDSNMFLGGTNENVLDRLNQQDALLPGQYSVDVLVNNKLYKKLPVEFVENSADGKVYPCLNDEVLVSAGIILTTKADAEINANSCMPLGNRIAGSSTHFDQAKLRLNLSIPQVFMKNLPRGYVDPSQLDDGEPVVFVNYMGNYYQTNSNINQSSKNAYGYLNMKAGANIGLWQLRGQSVFQYNDNNGNTKTDWKNLRTYVQRPIIGWESMLTIGQNYTHNPLFDGLSYTGVNLSTDPRMLPVSRRGYAPEIRGVVATNAHVIIRQNNRIIYETNVAPGEFKIDDLFSTNYDGELDVEIIEADGSRSSFTVPFAAVPESMRAHASRYSITLGEVRNYNEINSKFAELTYERGLSNALTVNTGLRLADDYYAGLLGGVWSNRFGAFGLNGTVSYTKDENEEQQLGWRLQGSFSKSFKTTGTNFALAGYRYSSERYRDMNDVFGVRAAAQSGALWQSFTFQQRNQLSATISQDMEKYGQMYLSASRSDYYNNKDRNTQLRFGYSNNFNKINYNLSYSRQKNYTQTSPAGGETTQTRNQYMLTISIPLNFGQKNQYLSSSINHSQHSGTTYQTSLSGTLGESNSFSYAVQAGHDTESQNTMYGVNIQNQFSKVKVSANYTHSDNFEQIGGGIQGAVVAHAGGVTFGPYLSETFGIVEAKGAKGALVRNTQNSKIDRFGYAVIPSLTPYRENMVTLDPKGIDRGAELQENQSVTIPHAGVAIKTKFSTRQGHAVLIQSEGLLMGAEVFDEEQEQVGMVGQGSQVYARVKNSTGKLQVRWGDEEDEKCILTYQIPSEQKDKALANINSICNYTNSSEK